MDLEIEDLLLSPSSCNPSEPLSITTINDPTFTRVDLIRKNKIENLFTSISLLDI
jgi:hypothetical protein